MSASGASSVLIMLRNGRNKPWNMSDTGSIETVRNGKDRSLQSPLLCMNKLAIFAVCPISI
jgi:hypothetical protein